MQKNESEFGKKPPISAERLALYETIDNAYPDKPITWMTNKMPDEDQKRLEDPAEPEFDPRFDSPNLFTLTDEEISSRQAILFEAIKAMHERPEDVEDDLQIDRAQKGIKLFDLLIIARKMQTAEGEELEALKQEFKRINEAIVGPYNPELYQGIANEAHELIEIVLSMDGQENRGRIARELQQMLPPKKGEAKIVRLPQETFEEYSKAFHLMFDNFLDEALSSVTPEEDGSYNVDQVAQIFKNILRISGFDTDDNGDEFWKVVIKENLTSLNIEAKAHEVQIPKDRPNIAGNIIRPRLVHEYIHIMRSVLGEKRSILAGRGLPEYLDVEEGLNAFAEQFMSGSQTANITYVERYAGVGFARGELSGQEQSFAKTFAMMWRIRLLFETANQAEDVTVEQIKAARKDSRANAQRLFRGNPDNSLGLGWQKDQTYYGGQAKTADLLIRFRERYGLENLYWLFLGKYDFLEPVQNKYMNTPIKD